MTSYGPWIQDPDVVRTNEAGSFAGDRWRTDYFEVAGPYGTVNAGTYTALSIDANVAPPTTIHSPEPSLTIAPFAFVWVQDETSLEDPDGKSEIRSMREAYRVLNVSPYTEGIIFYRPPDGLPDGAVGIQWEGYDPSLLFQYAPAEVVGLEISGPLTQAHHDSENYPEVDHLKDGDEFVMAIVADVGESWDSGSEPPAPATFFDNDLIDQGVWDPSNAAGALGDVVARVAGPAPTDYTTGTNLDPVEVPTNMLDAMGRVLLYTKLDFDTLGPLGAATTEQPEPPGITGMKAYGYHLTSGMTATWTLRPPRYRWIYGQGAAPPLRLFPRHDNLGNTPRLYPPPITRQRSNRATGYL